MKSSKHISETPGSVTGQAPETAPEAASSRRILTVAGGHFVHDTYSSFLPTFLPLIIERSSISMALAGLLTVFFRASSLANPFLGVLADRKDFRYLFAACPGITAIFFSMLGLSSSYPLLCLMLLAAGFSASMFHVIGPIFITRFSGARLGRGMSWWMVAGELGRSLGPVLAATAIKFLGFENTWVLMVFGISASVVLFFQIRDVPKITRHKSQMPTMTEAWKELMPVMLPITGLLISRACLVGILSGYLPAYLVISKGESVWLGGIALAFFELLGTAGTFAGGSLSDFIGRKKVLYAGMITGPAAMLGLVYASGWQMIPCLAVIALFGFAGSPVLLAIVQEHAGKNRGAANGLYMCFNFISNALILLFIGALQDQYGFDITLMAAAGLALIGLPSIMALPKKQVV